MTAITDMERRCIDAAIEADDEIGIAQAKAIVRAVLAEAGVAEMQQTIDAQAATIAELRVFVQSAYYEGWEDAQDACSTNVLFSSNSIDDWEISTSRERLAGAA